MNILISGRGSSGSFQIRGVQIGAALGARVSPNASDEDIAWSDIIILVKRIPGDLLHRVRRSGKPWVYDIVDAYGQPEASSWSEQQARHWLQVLLAGLQPTAVIWPTAAMQACAPYIRGTVINHHHRPGIKRNPIREQLKTVGYEGAPQYLGEWTPAFEKACAAIGARFVVNPPSLADLDLAVAVRGKEHHGWVQRNWKSNVKLANAEGSGTPILCQIDEGYGGLKEPLVTPICWLHAPDMIDDWLRCLSSHGQRERIGKLLYERAYSVDDAAKDYRSFLCALKS